MPDIKNEKLPTPAEKPPLSPENLKPRVGGAVEKERLADLEQAREKVIDEITRADNKVPPTIGPVGPVLAAGSKQQKKIEGILSEGLSDIYLNLSPEKRGEFRRAGEETAKKISLILSKTKINVGEIIKLIKKWLSLIPGVNKYFLEQEAKIKADEIIKMKQK